MLTHLITTHTQVGYTNLQYVQMREIEEEENRNTSYVCVMTNL